MKLTNHNVQYWHYGGNDWLLLFSQLRPTQCRFITQLIDFLCLLIGMRTIQFSMSVFQSEDQISYKPHFEYLSNSSE